MICSTSEKAQEHQKPRTPKQKQGLILGTRAKLNVVIRKNIMSIRQICVWGKKNCSRSALLTNST